MWEIDERLQQGRLAIPETGVLAKAPPARCTLAAAQGLALRGRELARLDRLVDLARADGADIGVLHEGDERLRTPGASAARRSSEMTSAPELRDPGARPHRLPRGRPAAVAMLQTPRSPGRLVQRRSAPQPPPPPPAAHPARECAGSRSRPPRAGSRRPALAVMLSSRRSWCVLSSSSRRTRRV